MYALAMSMSTVTHKRHKNLPIIVVTKAGVPSWKVNVGIASHGRSFGMSDTTCSGPNCFFNGPNSTAEEGDCTGTAGILARAEIDEYVCACTLPCMHLVKLFHF